MIDLGLLGARADGCDLLFPAGLPGFADAHRFVVLPWDGPEPYALLRCLDRDDCSFVVVAPALLDATLDVRAAIDRHPALTDRDAATVRCIVVPAPRPTVNLLGPLVVDRSNGIAHQVSLDLPHHATRSPLALRG